MNGGTIRNKIAAFDITTGTATAWNPNMSGPVSALIINGSNIYAGGTFTTVNGATLRNNLAALDLTTGIPTAWDPNANSSVNTLLINGTNMYAGGLFSLAGSKTAGSFADLGSGF